MMLHTHKKGEECICITETEEQSLSLKETMQKKETWAHKVADAMTQSFGTVWFFNANALLFLLWVVVNLGIIPGVPVFDPFPYGLLTMAVSLEAIFLSIIVLISQNRASDIADLREELDLKINIRSEEEITRIINMLDEVHDFLGLNPEDDEELKSMKKKTDVLKMRDDLVREMSHKKKK